jgi:L-threonylcarbamoyladenylate synthase
VVKTVPRTVNPIQPIHPNDPEDECIREAVKALEDGGVLAIPTDTVYGLAADIARPDALRRVYEIKARPLAKALVLFLADLSQASDWIEDSPALRRLAARFWPGPLTIVVPASPRVPEEVRAEDHSVALRVPGHAVPRRLVLALGRPLVTTSANLSGSPSLTDAPSVHRALGADLSMVLDAGPSAGGQASTVLSLMGPAPRLLRVGPVSDEALREVLPDLRP